MIHFAYDGPWLHLSAFGRTMRQWVGVKGPWRRCVHLLAHKRTRECLTVGRSSKQREHVNADFHWGTAYPTISSLEILTAPGVGCPPHELLALDSRWYFSLDSGFIERRTGLHFATAHPLWLSVNRGPDFLDSWRQMTYKRVNVSNEVCVL